MSPNPVSVGAATSVVLSVSDGPGNTTDWIALYPVGAADTSYLAWSYLSGSATPPASGLTSATLTSFAPIAAGDYEWRLFANNGWSRIATTSIVTVTASAAVLTTNGVSAPAVATVGSGTSVVVSVSGGPGNPTDWIGLAPAGSPDTTLVDWRYLNGTTVPPTSGMTSGTVQFLAPATAGNYEIRFFAHGTFGRLGTGGVTVAASTAALTVDGVSAPTVVSVTAGTYVDLVVTGGPAQPGDWVGLFAASAPDSGFLGWRYLNGTTTIPTIGVSNASLTFAVPVPAGSYEFRFFNANTFTRLATSTSMVVAASSATLSVNGTAAPASTTAAAGSQTVVSVAGGPANAGDWVGLFAVGGADSAFSDWRYLNDTAQLPGTGVSTATLHFGAPVAPGTYEFRFFTDTGGRLTVSGPVVVPETVAQIAVNGVLPPTPVTATPGSVIAVEITAGPANPTDWVALAAHDAPNGTYLAWQYLNGSTVPPVTGLSGGTLSFALPSTAGSYEIRLFAQNGYQRITTSAVIDAGSVEPDTTPPTIAATISPAPNAAGWHNTPVTVSFACVDNINVATCSAPITVTQQGANQLVTGTVTDSAGLQANVSVSISIDSEPPVVSLIDPSADLSTTVANLAVSASASDSGSGLMKAICNGLWANPSGGTVSCNVPLKPGRNTVIVSAVDFAGNVASAGIRATRVTPPTSLSMTPSTVAMAVGDANVLSVTTNTGLPATGLTWESSDPDVVAIAPENDGTITAETLGVATITVTLGSLSAETSVRVLPGGVELGEAIWTAAPPAGTYLQGILRANPVQDDDPDLFSLEFKPGAGDTVKAIRAADGATLWSESVAERPVPDAFGGFLIKGAGGPSPVQPAYGTSSLRRVGQGTVGPWEYVSPAYIDKVAAALDGTVYFTEFVLTSQIPESPSFPYPGFDFNVASAIVALDGRTGAVRFRIPMPTSSREFPDRLPFQEGCPVVHHNVKEGGSFGPITVLENGDAAVQHLERHLNWTTPCPGETEGTSSDSFTLRQWRVTAEGAASSHILSDWSQSWPADPYGSHSFVGQETFYQGMNGPDGRGGVLATWYRTAYDGSTLLEESRLTQISSAGSITPRPNPPQGFGSESMTTSDGTAYLPEGPNGELVARSTDSWATLWAAPTYGVPTQGLNNGGLLWLTSDDGFTPLLKEADSTGTVVNSYTTSIYAPIVALRDQGLLHGLDVNGGLSMISVSGEIASEWSFLGSAFDSCLGNGAPKLNADVSATKQIGLVPRAEPYTYRIQDFPQITPSGEPEPRHWRPDQIDGVREAFNKWNSVLATHNLGISYRELSLQEVAAGAIPDINIQKSTLAPGADGFFAGAEPFLPNRRIVGGGMFFNANPSKIFSRKGFFKTALHEIGHTLGLTHPSATIEFPEGKPSDANTVRGSSVMNPNGSAKPPAPPWQLRDDFLNFVPTTPTSCDIKAVQNAIAR